jgi:hypothetical protein
MIVQSLFSTMMTILRTTTMPKNFKPNRRNHER